MSMTCFRRHVRVAKRQGDGVSLILLSKGQQRECKTLAYRNRFILTPSSRLETMERELRELQENLKTSGGQEVEKSPAILQPMSPDDSSLGIPVSDYSVEHLTASIRSRDDLDLPRSIEGVELDASMVATLLQEYSTLCLFRSCGSS